MQDFGLKTLFWKNLAATLYTLFIRQPC